MPSPILRPWQQRPIAVGACGFVSQPHIARCGCADKPVPDNLLSGRETTTLTLMSISLFPDVNINFV